VICLLANNGLQPPCALKRPSLPGREQQQQSDGSEDDPRCQFEGGKMLDELKEEAIVNKVGGRLELSALIQKRLKALQKGARPLVKVRGDDKLTIVIQEILQDKIYLDLSG
jgi:DNA-directed RNA polymerase subunit omega